MADAINPLHYEGVGGWQSIDVIEAFVPDKPHRWAALKYIFRAGKKDPAKEVEDLRKAIWWLEREISHLAPKSSVAQTDCQGERRLQKSQCVCTSLCHAWNGGLKEDYYCRGRVFYGDESIEWKPPPP